MKILSFFINLPWTVLGLIGGLASLPAKTRIHRNPAAIIIHVRSFWWLAWRRRKKGARAVTIGHVILLSPSIQIRDLEHELVHVSQFERAPLIQPLLYFYQTARYGYRQNKYEKEAYEKSGSRYIS